MCMLLCWSIEAMVDMAVDFVPRLLRSIKMSIKSNVYSKIIICNFSITSLFEFVFSPQLPSSRWLFDSLAIYEYNEHCESLFGAWGQIRIEKTCVCSNNQTGLAQLLFLSGV